MHIIQDRLYIFLFNQPHLALIQGEKRLEDVRVYSTVTE